MHEDERIWSDSCGCRHDVVTGLLLHRCPKHGGDPGESADLETKTMTTAQRAAALVIASQQDYDAAVELIKAVKQLREEAEKHHRPVIAAAHEAHRRALEALRRVDEPLKRAEAELKSKMARWLADQERIRLEEERRLREAAERAQAEALEAQLEAMEAAGARPEEIAVAIRQAEMMPVVAPRLEAPESQGIARRKTYKAHVYDLGALIRWVAEHPAQENLLAPNQSALNAMARAQGSALRIPGVRVVVEESVAVRR